MDSYKVLKAVSKLAVSDRKRYLKAAKAARKQGFDDAIQMEAAEQVERAVAYFYGTVMECVLPEDVVEQILSDFNEAFPANWQAGDVSLDEDGFLPVAADLYLRATSDTGAFGRHLSYALAGFTATAIGLITAGLAVTDKASAYGFSGTALALSKEADKSESGENAATVVSGSPGNVNIAGDIPWQYILMGVGAAGIIALGGYLIVFGFSKLKNSGQGKDSEESYGYPPASVPSVEAAVSAMSVQSLHPNRARGL